MGPLILLATYISFFGAVHSLMATKGFKNRVHKFVDPPQYRLTYTIVSILLFLPIPVIWGKGRGSSPPVFIVPYPYNLISYLVMLTAATLFIKAAMQTDLFEFLGLNAFLKKRETESKLITDGLYRVCRHPMYLFVMLIIWAVPELKLIDLVGNGFVTLYFVLGAWLEEQKMVEDFGQKYQEYRRNVSMFIPFMWFKEKLKS
ncbi:MAG: methyltransferase family protein [Candidatus Hydrothermarchaeales archaeon]